MYRVCGSHRVRDVDSRRSHTIRPGNDNVNFARVKIVQGDIGASGRCLRGISALPNCLGYSLPDTNIVEVGSSLGQPEGATHS